MKCRFVREYANYIKARYKAADIPNEQKKMYTKDIDMIFRKLSAGLITLTDAMETLAKADRWLNSYNMYG